MTVVTSLEASRDAFLDWRADENIAENVRHMTEKGCEVEVGILRVLAADATAAIAQLFLFDVRCGTLRLAKHFFVESFQELLSQFNHLVGSFFRVRFDAPSRASFHW